MTALQRTRIDRIASAYTDWIIRWRWWVLGISLLVAGGAGYGLRFLQFTPDYRVYFSADNPQRKAFEELENVYSKNDNIFIAIQPANKNIFTRDTLSLIRKLTEQGWQIPHATRVDSLTNFQYTRAEGDDLVISDLVAAPESMSDVQLNRVKQIALHEPALLNRVISKDGSTSGILVTLQMPGEDHFKHLPQSVNYARELVTRLRQQHPDLTVALTGIALLGQAVADVSQQEFTTLMPLMYGLIIAVMLLTLRSVLGTVSVLLVISFAVLTAVGIGSWLGVQLNPSSALAPVIILTMAVADSVHILSTFFQEMSGGKDRLEALRESLHVNTEPVFLTSLTTAIGFLSLNFADPPPFRDLGNIAATGVAAAWLYSMAALPALMLILPMRSSRKRVSERDRAMQWLGNFVVVNRKILLWCIAGSALVIGAFIPRLEIDDRFVQWFDTDLEFRRDTDFASNNLAGLYSLDFSVDSDKPGGVSDPAYLAGLGEFTNWLRAQPEVTSVNSISDTMKRLNKSLHGGEESWYKLPADRGLAAQYLLLYEMSLPYGLDLGNQINVDKSASRVTAMLRTVPMQQLQNIAARSEQWLQEHSPPLVPTEATGLTSVFIHLAERNIRSMFTGTAVAFLLISATLILALRSVRLGALSLIPNFLPAVMTFGVWSITVGHIGLIASMITATTLGLIVDDTVHLLSKYRRARMELSLTVHDAIRFSFDHVGRALWITTLILVAGFLVLTQSSFALNKDMGILTAMTLVFALVMDLLLLPPLIMALDKDPKCTCETCRYREPALS